MTFDFFCVEVVSLRLKRNFVTVLAAKIREIGVEAVGMESKILINLT